MPQVQARAASVLGVRRLISLLKDERAENRRSIVSLLANPSIEVDDTEEFAILLVPLLSDANADFRRLVVEAWVISPRKASHHWLLNKGSSLSSQIETGSSSKSFPRLPST